jgi:hypothetical protein
VKRGVLWAVGAAFVLFLLAGCRGSTTPDTARARRSARPAKLCATPGCRRIISWWRVKGGTKLPYRLRPRSGRRYDDDASDGGGYHELCGGGPQQKEAQEEELWRI